MILCAIIELGLGAHSLAAVSTLDLPTFAWTGLGVAVAVLTLLTLPAMYVTSSSVFLRELTQTSKADD